MVGSDYYANCSRILKLYDFDCNSFTGLDDHWHPFAIYSHGQSSTPKILRAFSIMFLGLRPSVFSQTTWWNYSNCSEKEVIPLSWSNGRLVMVRLMCCTELWMLSYEVLFSQNCLHRMFYVIKAYCETKLNKKPVVFLPYTQKVFMSTNSCYFFRYLR